MRTYQHPIYQDNTMAIRAEYDEEKRVFDLMKKFLYIVGTITAIVVFLLLLVNSPALITQTGAIGIIALVPVLLAATAFTGFYVGTGPGGGAAGYIAAWRAIKRSKLFVWGNALGLLLIATLLLSIPAAFAPIAFLLQWLKVSNLKRQLDANA